MSQTAREHRLLQSSIADLHEQLGKSLADYDDRIARPSGGHWNARTEHFRGLYVDASVRPVHRVPVEETPFVAALRLDWKRASIAADEAWARFRKHGDRARYRDEMKAIGTDRSALRDGEG